MYYWYDVDAMEKRLVYTIGWGLVNNNWRNKVEYFVITTKKSYSIVSLEMNDIENLFVEVIYLWSTSIFVFIFSLQYRPSLKVFREYINNLVHEEFRSQSIRVTFSEHNSSPLQSLYISLRIIDELIDELKII